MQHVPQCVAETREHHGQAYYHDQGAWEEIARLKINKW